MDHIGRFRVIYLSLPIILLFFFLAVDSLVGDSPTMDEQNHIGRGLAFLKSGDPRFSLEHPPLINMLSALPLLTIPELRIPFDHPSWNEPEGWYSFSEQLLWVYNANVTQMVFLARIPIVFVTIGLGLIAYRFSLEIWGREAGLLVLALILFDPNILAHGRYSTTDVGGAATMLLATFTLWRMNSSSVWKWRRIAAAGIAFGLALASKLSNMVFMPAFFVLATLPIYELDRYKTKIYRRIIGFLIACTIGFIIVWATYAFEWQTFKFQSQFLAGLDQYSGPMPTFFAGIEKIAILSVGGRPAFLLGEFSTDGWWYYFPIAFLVKTPIIVIVLFIVSIFILLRNKNTRGRAIYLLVPIVWFFIVTLVSGLNIGYRHLLPILPMMYVLSSGVWQPHAMLYKRKYLNAALGKSLVLVAVFVLVVTDILLHPNYLSYFNFFARGPENGHNVLIDSNIDWGQDLLRLKDWMDVNQIEKVNLSWFGSADPTYYGIDYSPLPGLPRNFDLWWNVPFNTVNPEPGVYAISVSNLWELPLEDKHVFTWFRNREPDARIGYSIHIYFVGDDSVLLNE